MIQVQKLRIEEFRGIRDLDEDAEIEVIDARGLSWRERQALRREIERQEQAWRKLGRVLRDLIWLAALSAGLS